MPFISYDEIKARQKDEAAALDRLKNDVAEWDANPIVAGSEYDHGDLWDGCYSGIVISKNERHVALYSKRANRVAIIPCRNNSPELGAVVSMTSFGSQLRTVRPLMSSFDWLDAMDDYIVALRGLRSFDLVSSGIRTEALVLLRDGSVSGSYRDHHAYRLQEARA